MWFWYAMVFSLAWVPEARAAVLQPYSLSDFLLTNTNADGTVMTPDFGLTIRLTGGNNGSGLSGSTDLLTTATQSALIRLHFEFSTLDLPMYDVGGYVIEGNFTPLADENGVSGVTEFAVTSGQIFGFRILTTDNIGEPGTLVLTEVPGTATPEPATLPTVLTFAVIALVVHRRRKRVQPRVDRHWQQIGLIWLGLSLSASSLFAQGQSFYAGSSVTGKLVLIGVTDLKAQTLRPQLLEGFSSAGSNLETDVTAQTRGLQPFGIGLPDKPET